mmetsp:Transcript_5486/g.16659  ORF Transcript_5486/g.16659 Transcript_5486/m.16659 type:complete len:204 (+) Transcript_5486:1560-2171(+)|eukprot:361603-Chlamydomonas_euryale.AAC.9
MRAARPCAPATRGGAEGAGAMRVWQVSSWRRCCRHTREWRLLRAAAAAGKCTCGDPPVLLLRRPPSPRQVCADSARLPGGRWWAHVRVGTARVALAAHAPVPCSQQQQSTTPFLGHTVSWTHSFLYGSARGAEAPLTRGVVAWQRCQERISLISRLPPEQLRALVWAQVAGEGSGRDCISFEACLVACVVPGCECCVPTPGRA